MGTQLQRCIGELETRRLPSQRPEEISRGLQSKMSVTDMVLIRSNSHQWASRSVPLRLRERLLYSREELPLLRAPGAGPAGYNGAPERIVRIEDEETVPAENSGFRHTNTWMTSALWSATGGGDSVPLGGGTAFHRCWSRRAPLRQAPRSPVEMLGMPRCSRATAVGCSSPHSVPDTALPRTAVSRRRTPSPATPPRD